jgi:NADH dehydrogenase FAD-containing subunit
MGTKHVVIVGGGFAGVGCAQQLARNHQVHVTLVDQHNYHQFQPLFYQVATSQLAPEDVGFSLGRIFRTSPNLDIKVAEVNAVDPRTRSVSTKEGQDEVGLAITVHKQGQESRTQTRTRRVERCGRRRWSDGYRSGWCLGRYDSFTGADKI